MKETKFETLTKVSAKIILQYVFTVLDWTREVKR